MGLGTNVAIVVLSWMAGPPQSPSAEDVIRGLEDAEKLLSNLSVTSHMQVTEVSPKYGTERSTRMVATFTVDSAGRSRYKGEFYDADDRITKTIIETYDGAEFRSLEGVGEPFERFQFGRISAHSHDRTRPITPWDYTTRFGGYDVSELIRDHGVEAYGVEDWHGRPVGKILTKTINTDQEYRKQYLIDFARGFSAVRKAALVRSKPDDSWFEYKTVEGGDYLEAAPNIWVPQEVRQVIYQPVSTNPEPVLRRRLVIKNENWHVNETLKDDTFKVEFPPDVSVTDTIRGTTYKTTRITDQTLVDSLAESRTAASLERPGGAAHPLGRYAMILGALIAGASLSAVFLRRRAAKRPGTV